MGKLVSTRNLILTIILILGVFLRFYKLTEYPIHLNLDEISQLYEAISISETSNDIYGNHLPAVFPLFGVYSPGHYIYITTLAYKIFGWQEITIRIPAAIMGTMTILAVIFFVKVLFDNWKIAAISGFFTAILPSELFYSRKSFEYMVGHFLIFFGFSMLILYVKKGKDNLFGIVGMTSLVLAIYTYTAHATTVPLLLIAFAIIFKDKLIERRRYLLPTVLGLIFIVPLVFLLIVNPDILFRPSTIFITQDVNLGRLLENAKTDSGIRSIIIQTNTFIGYIFNRYLIQFDPSYLFGNGLDLTNQSAIDIGPLYYFQLPLVILGIIFITRLTNFTLEKRIFMSLVILSMIPGSLTFESHSPHRSVMTFTLISIVSSFGFYWLIKLVNKLMRKNLKYILFGLIATVGGLNFIYFVHIYTVNYSYEKSQNIHYPFKEVALYAWSQYSNFNTIVFDPKYGKIAPMVDAGAHYYFAYYGSYPPEKFQKEYKADNKRREIDFDKFSIREIYWPVDKDLKNTLVIVSPWSVPVEDVDKSKIIKRFNFYDGQLAFYAIKL